MSPEPHSNESLIRGASEQLIAAEASQIIFPKSFEPSSLPQGMDGEGEDLAFAKAQTLMIDLEQTPIGQNSGSVGMSTEMPSKHYIQGVVQGQQSYLITNLLGGSITLFQPQMVWTLGRNRGAALPLRDRLLSRRHAVIMFVLQEGFNLVDLNSMNGSFLNGNRIQQRQLLKDGDRIRLGSFEFNFFISQTSRTIEPIHPEVLARFTSSKSCQEGFMDYSALEEPEILFRELPK